MSRHLAATFFLFASIAHAAVEPGFVDLLESGNISHWKQCGPGKMSIVGGEAVTSTSREVGVAWYSKTQYADFILKVEFKGVGPEFNSGLRLRLPSLGNDPAKANELGYEVGIHYSLKPYKWGTGSIHRHKTPTTQALKPLDWNEFEISVIGQEYSVVLNGQLVNRFTGSRALSGYIGLEENSTGDVKFRNLRIKDLSNPAEASQQVSSNTLSSIQTDPNQPRIAVIKDQGPNATEWALTPLDEAIPADIRQNLTYLREDLLDEGSSAAAKAKPEAYKLASDYCDKVLAALDQRDLARANAGYRHAQADADKRTSNQALDARRNYQMSWPQYAREESQRAALREKESDKADVKKERLKVDWATRSVKMRAILDDLYRQLREAMR